ncbi:GPO family capsid scaffolding protein [Endozoicomonas montiporae]|uniref:Capsid scaffolding protein n=1 Tax=Endozoicomonas montiporae CL-33 TaxID=570277 RepID=A0A142BB52_9GAMM|nr:GPO family capsid scaffolding protein [Endozoicomonas montiporae]AMO55978.1 hypothetical protein EZMO1_1835 [Endozoicomonas montiporae CL-33]
MPKLITDWVKVAESGTTLDGRIIEKSWLLDAAELYSKEKYTAVITLEHYSPEWAGNYGTVEELKSETDGEVVSLFAKLCPNDRLISINRSGQNLFTSIKVHPNFGDSGKAYVYQIGVTDTPASMGTTQLEFRAGRDEEIFQGVQLSQFSFSSESEEQTLLKKLTEWLVFSTSNYKVSEDEDDSMKPEELEKLTTSITSAVADSITTAFKSLKEETPEPPAPKPEPKPEPTAEVTAEAFSAQKEELEKTRTDLDAMTEKFNALEKRLEGTVPPTDPSVENTGGADDSAIEYI